MKTQRLTLMVVQRKGTIPRTHLANGEPDRAFGQDITLVGKKQFRFIFCGPKWLSELLKMPERFVI